VFSCPPANRNTWANRPCFPPCGRRGVGNADLIQRPMKHVLNEPLRARENAANAGAVENVAIPSSRDHCLIKLLCSGKEIAKRRQRL
jgi:hypothetical protein